jgi:anti-sigma regulatory factor (Ser/Thr protein kinase)
MPVISLRRWAATSTSVATIARRWSGTTGASGSSSDVRVGEVSAPVLSSGIGEAVEAVDGVRGKDLPPDRAVRELLAKRCGAVLRAPLDLPTTTGSVPIARHLVAQLLAAWSAKARHEESMLLLSELVTNVVRHVRPSTTFTIELILSQLKLRMSVLDGSPTPPVVRDRSPASGHDLWLVTAMADRWGSARHGAGKQVWFELDQ